MPAQNQQAQREAARGGEHEADEHAGDVKHDGVLGEKAEADGCADGEPPTRILGLEKADGEVRDENPPEEVERGVLEFCAVEDRNRRKSDREGRSDLSEARAAEVAGHETGETNDCDALREDGKQAQTDQGEAKEARPMRSRKGVEGRISDESPVEMARIAEELQLVAMKAVAAVGEDDAGAPPRLRCRRGLQRPQSDGLRGWARSATREDKAAS